jgi:hypothetical protein
VPLPPYSPGDGTNLPPELPGDGGIHLPPGGVELLVLPGETKGELPGLDLPPNEEGMVLPPNESPGRMLGTRVGRLGEEPVFPLEPEE